MSDPHFNYQLYKVAQEQFELMPNDLSDEQKKEVVRVAQRKIHIEEAILTAPEALRVSVPSSQIKEALLKIQQTYDSKNQFLMELDGIGISEEELYASLGRELKVDAILELVCSEVPEKTNTDASLFYYMNISRFKRPEVRKARHILITVNPEYPENERDIAWAKIHEIKKRLAKKPDRFEEQAMKHSECPTSMQGGLLGDVRKGVLFPELEMVLFKMSVGEISDVVESELGFHILMCESIEQESTAPVEEVLPKLREQLTLQERRKFQKHWVNQRLLNLATSERRQVNG